MPDDRKPELDLHGGPPRSPSRPVVSEACAELDVSRVAVLGPRSPLLFAGGGSEGEDYPGFARAASALRRWQRRLVVIQDDVNALAVGWGGTAAPLEPWLLPRGSDGRRRFDDTLGNKHLKLDLEAATVLPDGRLLALGSGSTSARERLVLVEPGGRCTLHDAAALYAHLRGEVAFAGSELNVEGVVVSGGSLRLFQRGNGSAVGALQPVSAVGDLALAEFTAWLDGSGPVPALTRVVQVVLGREQGVPLGFTDATLLSSGAIAFLACAENSPDVTRDGEVLACRLGVLTEVSAHLIQIVDEDGSPCRLKLEGIEVHPQDDDAFDVVADVDSPERPALGAVLRIFPAPPRP